jgi:nicotinamide riboside kinase
MFGLSGAHRAGKSTLARAVAERIGIHNHDGSATMMLRERGIDMVAITDPFERLQAQNTLLDLYLEKLKTAPRPAITDRTPLDMATYMLAEMGMHSDPELGNKVWEYVGRCVEETEKHFDTVFIVSPLPFYVVEPNKPKPNKAYQMHFHMLLRGILDATDNLCLFTIGTPDMERRVRLCGGYVQGRLEEMRQAAAAVKPH